MNYVVVYDINGVVRNMEISNAPAERPYRWFHDGKGVEGTSHARFLSDRAYETTLIAWTRAPWRYAALSHVPAFDVVDVPPPAAKPTVPPMSLGDRLVVLGAVYPELQPGQLKALDGFATLFNLPPWRTR